MLALIFYAPVFQTWLGVEHYTVAAGSILVLLLALSTYWQYAIRHLQSEYRREVEAIHKTIAALQEENAWLRQQLAEHRKWIDSLQAENQRLRKELAQVRRENLQRAHRIEQLERENEELRDRLDKLMQV